MKTYTLLWKRLKKIRTEGLKLSQEATAYKLGITRNTYMKYELGYSVPQPHNLVKIVDLFGQEVYKEC